MNREDVLTQFNSLPPEGQQAVLDFIAILRARYGIIHPAESREPLDPTIEPFIGMWQDRADMQDSSEWVRNSREREWVENSG